jgi:hypothetical protein
MATPADWQIKVEAMLTTLARENRLITYLEMAEHASIPSPHRIHQLTQFLEDLIARDAKLGQPIRATRVVSKKDGLPADGFFDCLVKNGMMATGDEDRIAFYKRLLCENR